MALGDFNAKLRQWYDKNSSTSEGISIENITSKFGLHQIINEPTHILEDSSLCIDLIFTNAYRKKSNNIQLRNNLRSLQQRLRDLIDDSKQKYFLRLSQKLTTIQKNTKAYWTLLKIFLNNRKIPVILPLFHNNKFITDETWHIYTLPKEDPKNV